MRVRGIILAGCLAALGWGAGPAWAQEDIDAVTGLPPSPVTQSVYGGVGIWGDYRPRLGVQYRSEGAGYSNGFTSLEAFVPAFYAPESTLAFVDSRVFFDNEGELGLNVGGGVRQYVEAYNAVFGLNGYYDARDTGPSYFHQMGFGAEFLGRWVDIRSNATFILNDERNVIASSGLGTTSTTTEDVSNARFQGNNIIFDVMRQTTTSTSTFVQSQAAFNTVDVELGGGVPYFSQLLRVYGGFYYYGVKGSETAYGAKGRIECRLQDFMTANLIIQNDTVFDTNIVFGGAFYFPGYRPRGARRSRLVVDRLGEPVERNQAIVVRTQAEIQTQTQTVIDNSLGEVGRHEVTGEPILVFHVNRDAAPNGNGTIETPFSNLTDAETGSVEESIVYVHADQVFDGNIEDADFALQQGQRFLGEGITHLVPTTEGLIELPRATTGTNIPTLTNAPMDAITIAVDNTETSGFNITNAGDDGIQVTGTSSFIVNRTSISNAVSDGMELMDVTGTGLIDQMTITGGMRGINGQFAATGRLEDLQITNSTIGGQIGAGTGDGAVSLNFSANSASSVTVANNEINRGNMEGLFVGTNDASNTTVLVDSNTFNGADQDGIETTVADGSILDMTISNNTILGASGMAIEIDTDNASISTFTISGNSIMGSGFSGVDINTNGDSMATVSFLNNTVSGSQTDGMTLNLDDNSIMIALVDGNTFMANGAQGLDIDLDANTPMFSGGINNNTFTGNNFSAAGFGLEFDSASTAANGACLQMVGNNSDTDYQLQNTGTMFQVEQLDMINTLNTGTVNFLPNMGAFTNVAEGTCTLPAQP